MAEAAPASSAPAEVKKCRVLIVGGGPAGLTAAIYAGRANLNPVIAVGGFERGLYPGGQLMITTEVENFPGFPEGIQGPELIEKMNEQAKRFNVTFVEEFAKDFEFKPGGPHTCKLGDVTYEADSIILAMGAQARWLGAPGEDKWMNKGISACATCDGPLPCFRGKRLLVVGGGDSAMEEASFLTKFASKVSIVHRRDALRASKIMQERVLKHPKIEVLWNSVIVGYKGETSLTSVTIQDTKTGETRDIEVGGVFMAIGHDPCVKYLKDHKGAQVEMESTGYIKVHDHIRTSVEGVFTCGDVHDSHFKQAISAAGFGCMAAIACERWLEEKAASQ